MATSGKATPGALAITLLTVAVTGALLALPCTAARSLLQVVDLSPVGVAAVNTTNLLTTSLIVTLTTNESGVVVFNESVSIGPDSSKSVPTNLASVLGHVTSSSNVTITVGVNVYNATPNLVNLIMGAVGQVQVTVSTCPNNQPNGINVAVNTSTGIEDADNCLLPTGPTPPT